MLCSGRNLLAVGRCASSEPFFFFFLDTSIFLESRRGGRVGLVDGYLHDSLRHFIEDSLPKCDMIFFSFHIIVSPYDAGRRPFINVLRFHITVSGSRTANLMMHEVMIHFWGRCPCKN